MSAELFKVENDVPNNWSVSLKKILLRRDVPESPTYKPESPETTPTTTDVVEDTQSTTTEEELMASSSKDVVEDIQSTTTEEELMASSPKDVVEETPSVKKKTTKTIVLKSSPTTAMVQDTSISVTIIPRKSSPKRKVNIKK